jgi:hypothetical protein
VTEPLEDLAQRWAEAAVARGELDAARALGELDDFDEQSADRDAALRALHSEPDDDQPWRRAA